MPELPETEVVASQLRKACLGAEIDRIEILHPQILDRKSDLGPVWYEKAVIQKIGRHGKQIVLTTVKEQKSCSLGIRLGMTGRLLMQKIGAVQEAHTHAVICFSNRPYEIHFRDPRRFGRIAMLTSPSALFQGLDPLAMEASQFVEAMLKRNGRIKSVLMNQNIMAGIGNIYANEILFEAGIHPHQKVSRLGPALLEELWRVMKVVLQKGIKKGGTTIRDFRSLYGRTGSFQKFLKIYGRAGLSCSRPGCTEKIRLLRPSRQAQPSFYCPRCQPKR